MAARELWTPLARAGDPEAQFGMGLLYDLGSGVPENTGRAYEWYRRAAESGLPAAEFNVGVMNDSGRGVPSDHAEAALWYSLAAAHGFGRAEFNLAQLYADGDGVPRNTAAAAAWYRAASRTVPAAARDLAMLRKAEPANDQAPSAIEALRPLAPGNLEPIQPKVAPLSVELAWLAPPQPVPVHFYVEMRAVEGASSHDMFSGYTDVTALLVPLTEATSYEWRVSAVATKGGQQAAGTWQRFSVEAPAPTPAPASAEDDDHEHGRKAVMAANRGASQEARK